MQNYHMDRCKYDDYIWSDIAAYKQECYIGHAFRIRPSRGTPKSKKCALMYLDNHVLIFHPNSDV